jgi:carbohydrate-selective porin OprB
MRRAWVVFGILTALVSLTAAMPAFAGAKDETSAEWIPFVPPSVTKWRDDLANKGLSFGWTYIGDTIGNVSGGFKRGTISASMPIWKSSPAGPARGSTPMCFRFTAMG